MGTSILNKLVKIGGVTLAALFLVWGGPAAAGEGPGPMNYTAISKASVLINYFEQTGEGEASAGKFRTDDMTNALIGAEPGSSPPSNLQLVLLSSCDDPESWKALGVWDKDADQLAEAGIACLWRESSAVYRSSSNKFYQGLDISSSDFGLQEVDMDVEVTVGSVPGRINSDEPVCVKKLRTLTMAGYYSNGPDGAIGNRVMRQLGQIKTNGGVIATWPGIDELLFACD